MPSSSKRPHDIDTASAAGADAGGGGGGGHGAIRAAASTSILGLYRQLHALMGLAFLEGFSIGIVLPMVPIVTTEFFARQHTAGAAIDCGHHSRHPACIEGSKEADSWLSLISAVGSVCFFFLSSTIGQASDVYGRKPFVVFSQLMRAGLPFTIMYFVEWGGTIWPYLFLRFLCHVFETMGVTSAAIADIVHPNDRATAFGVLFAVWSIAFSISAGIAGFFTRYQILQVSAVLFIQRVLWAVFVFPETLPPTTRVGRRAAARRMTCKNPLRGMSILLRTTLFTRLTIMIVLTTFVSSGMMQIRMFYLNTIIGFDEKDTSHLMLAFGIGSILAQVLLLKPLMQCGKEKGVIIVSLVAKIIECIGYVASAFVPEKWVIYATTVPNSIGDLSFSAISSLKSINCSEQEQGRLQGAIYGARAIVEAIGPVAFAVIYSRMKEEAQWSRALPFAVSAVLYVCGLGVAMLLPKPSADARPPIPFSPVSSVASSPLASSLGATILDYDDEDDASTADPEDLEACLSEPLLGEVSLATHGIRDV